MLQKKFDIILQVLFKVKASTMKNTKKMENGFTILKRDLNGLLKITKTV